MGSPYKNPPLAEAIAEFRFPPGSAPDVVVPGLFYQQLKSEFPKSRPAVGIEGSLQAGPSGVQQRLTQTARLQLLREDERIIVQVSPNWLAVNHVPPYRSWEDEYLPTIERALAAYVSASSVPVLLAASLRYVNRVPLKDGVDLKDFFTVYPTVEGGAVNGVFRLGLQFPVKDGKNLLQVEMAPYSDPADSAGWGVQLELFYIYGGDAPIPVADARAWLCHAHDAIEEFFERAIKDTLRERFVPIKAVG